MLEKFDLTAHHQFRCIMTKRKGKGCGKSNICLPIRNFSLWFNVFDNQRYFFDSFLNLLLRKKGLKSQTYFTTACQSFCIFLFRICSCLRLVLSRQWIFNFNHLDSMTYGLQTTLRWFEKEKRNKNMCFFVREIYA